MWVSEAGDKGPRPLALHRTSIENVTGAVVSVTPGAAWLQVW
jgi:hypothetical protein